MAFEKVMEKKSKYNINRRKKRSLGGNTKRIFVEWPVYKNNINVENFSLNMASSFSAQ